MSFKHPYTAAFLGGDRQPMSGAAMTSEGLPAETGIISVDAVGMRTLNLAEKIVMTSGVEDMLARWRTEDGADPSKGGRPRIISDTMVLILMSIIAIESRPMHLQQAVDIITRRASNDVLRRLGLPERDKDDYTSAAGLHAWYMRLHRVWNRVRSVVDPYPEVSYHERMTKDEFDAVVKMRDVAAIQTKMKRLAAFDNALIMASVAMMPAEHQGAWAGDVCVDGTPIPAAKKGTTRLGQLASSEPDAGWYVRDGEHRGDEQRDGVSKLMWAYEASIAPRPSLPMTRAPQASSSACRWTSQATASLRTPCSPSTTSLLTPRLPRATSWVTVPTCRVPRLRIWPCRCVVRATR